MDESTIGNSEYNDLIWNVEQTVDPSMSIDAEAMMREMNEKGIQNVIATNSINRETDIAEPSGLLPPLPGQNDTILPLPVINGMDTPEPPVERIPKEAPKRRRRLNKPRSLVRIKWSEEEDEKLRKLVEKHGKKNWKLISQELGSARPDTECRQHYVRVLERKSVKGRWNFDEIIRLVDAVSRESDWTKIATIVETRDKCQCILKWRSINRVNTGAKDWTPEEHLMMIHLYKKIPKCWQLIADEIATNVTAEDVENHYKLFLPFGCFTSNE